jgi:hypothetical protein
VYNWIMLMHNKSNYPELYLAGQPIRALIDVNSLHLHLHLHLQDTINETLVVFTI